MDRNNRDEILKQIGRTEESIKNKNHRIGAIDKELNRWPKRKEHLLKQKKSLIAKISGQQKYINLLNQDIKKL